MVKWSDKYPRVFLIIVFATQVDVSSVSVSGLKVIQYPAPAKLIWIPLIRARYGINYEYFFRKQPLKSSLWMLACMWGWMVSPRVPSPSDLIGPACCSLNQLSTVSVLSCTATHAFCQKEARVKDKERFFSPWQIFMTPKQRSAALLSP